MIGCLCLVGLAMGLAAPVAMRWPELELLATHPLGRTYVLRFGSAGALNMAEDSSAVTGRDASLAIAIGNRLWATEQPSAASAHWRRVPGAARDFVARGDAHAERQRWQEAATEYRKAISVDPANGGGWCRLGAAQRELGEASAEGSLRRGWDGRAQLAGRDLASCAWNLALLATWRGDLLEARSLAWAALAAEPLFYNAWLTLAIVELERGDSVAAQGAIAVARRLAPWYADVWETGGRIFEAAGEPAVAAAWYQEAVALKPGSTTAASSLARALEAASR